MEVWNKFNYACDHGRVQSHWSAKVPLIFASAKNSATCTHQDLRTLSREGDEIWAWLSRLNSQTD